MAHLAARRRGDGPWARRRRRRGARGPAHSGPGSASAPPHGARWPAPHLRRGCWARDEQAPAGGRAAALRNRATRHNLHNVPTMAQAAAAKARPAGEQWACARCACACACACERERLGARVCPQQDRSRHFLWCSRTRAHQRLSRWRRLHLGSGKRRTLCAGRQSSALYTVVEKVGVGKTPARGGNSVAAAAAAAVTEAHAHPAVVSTRACKTREKWRKTAARPTPLTRTPPQPCCTGMHRLGMLLSLLCAAVLVGAARGDCEDTPNWKAVHPKGHEFTCFTYVETG